MIVGLDLGNRYAKITTRYSNGNLDSIGYQDEFFVSWTEETEEDFVSQETKENISKVKHNGKYYFVGDIGNTSITNRNKGGISVIKDSRMIMLTMLARLMITMDKNSEIFQIVTGTPFDYYNAHAKDYEKLMICKNEVIEVNGFKCDITVSDCKIAKQGSCVIYTLPERKQRNYLIWDFGGETLDISYFEEGVRVKGLSYPFSLNRLYVDLGLYLSSYIEIDHPNILSGRYQKSIERLLLKGNYYNIKNIEVDGKPVLLEEFCHDWLTIKVDQVIEKVINLVDLNRTALANLSNCFVGGGARIIERELLANTRITNKLIFDDPQFANTKAYFSMGLSKKDWK